MPGKNDKQIMPSFLKKEEAEKKPSQSALQGLGLLYFT